MAVRSFRWLVSLAAVSVIALVAATVYLATSADEEGTFGGSVGRELGIDDGTEQEDDFELDLDDDEPFEYGDDLVLDDLFDACAEGDLVACDDLYFESPEGSAYEAFGSSCGGIEEDLFGDCAAAFGEDEAVEEEDLGVLYDACEAGEMEACDELYFESRIGSDEEEFGSTCGGRREETNGDCA